MRADIKKAPLGPMRPVIWIKKRGRSIASVAVSFTVPFTSGGGGIILRTAFAPVPFDPDIKAVFALAKRAFAPLCAIDLKHDETQNQGALKRIVNPTGFRAVAQHDCLSFCVENIQTRGMRALGAGSDVSTPSALNQPIDSKMSHVWFPNITHIVTCLRQRCCAASTVTLRTGVSA